MTSLSKGNVTLPQWRQNSFILEMSIIRRWTFYDWLFCSWLAALLLCSMKSSQWWYYELFIRWPKQKRLILTTDEDEWEDNSPGALTEDSGRGIVRITVMAFAHWRGFNFFDLVSSDADSGEVRQALNVSVTPTFINKGRIVYLCILLCCTNECFCWSNCRISRASWHALALVEDWYFWATHPDEFLPSDAITGWSISSHSPHLSSKFYRSNTRAYW